MIRSLSFDSGLSANSFIHASKSAIKVTGQKKRINEIVALAVGKGFDIHGKSIKHYTKGKGGVEYVLVRW